MDQTPWRSQSSEESATKVALDPPATHSICSNTQYESVCRHWRYHSTPFDTQGMNETNSKKMKTKTWGWAARIFQKCWPPRTIDKRDQIRYLLGLFWAQRAPPPSRGVGPPEFSRNFGRPELLTKGTKFDTF